MDYKFVYFDQNVLGDIFSGCYEFKNFDRHKVVFSDEHFWEIKRGENHDVLKVLSSLRPYKINMKIDSFGRITDEYSIDRCYDVIDAYKKFIPHADSDINRTLFYPFIAIIFGGDFDPDQVNWLVDKLIDLMMNVKTGNPAFDTLIAAEIKRTDWDSLRQIKPNPSLDLLRRKLKLHNGSASNYKTSDNPIIELWSHANNAYPPSIEIDEFFGFKNPHCRQYFYNSWPDHLAYSACYMTLNIIGFRPDKGLAKVNRVAANLSDSVHVAYARNCDIHC